MNKLSTFEITFLKTFVYVLIAIGLVNFGLVIWSFIK